MLNHQILLRTKNFIIDCLTVDIVIVCENRTFTTEDLYEGYISERLTTPIKNLTPRFEKTGTSGDYFAK